MQIVEINAKDIKDTLILVLEHDLGNSGSREELDTNYIQRILGSDWGFYYTVTQNLKKVLSFIPEFGDLKEEERKNIHYKIGMLLSGVENAKKSLGWKLRKKIGTKVRWYNEVDDITEGTGI